MSGFDTELEKHRIPDDWKGPEPTFNFSPSEGEPFTMTATEVADAMAFVRRLMAKSDNESDDTCPHCGGGKKYIDGSI